MMAPGCDTSTQENEAGTTSGRVNMGYTEGLKPSWII